jgi:hypothetical protein
VRSRLTLNDPAGGPGGQEVEESGCNCGEIMEIELSGFQSLWFAVDLSEEAVTK